MERYRIHALQRTGSNHRHLQDRCGWAQKPGRLLLAVADGHGRVEYTRSGLGARFAIAAAKKVLLSDPEPADIPAAIKDRFDTMVSKHLAFRPLSPRELALAKGMPHSGVYGTTLLAALITPGDTRLYQLGDGEFHAIGKDGSFLPDLPQDTDCRGSLTTSLANERSFALQHFRTLRYDAPVAALMLLTDGCEGGQFLTAQALTEPPVTPRPLQTMCEKTDRGDDQTVVLAYDITLLGEEFSRALTLSIQQAQKNAACRRRQQRQQEELQQLSVFLRRAEKRASRMEKTDDPRLQEFLCSLEPSLQRFAQLRKAFAAK